MPIATSDQILLGYWAETAWGTPPVATTPLKLVRAKGESFQSNLTYKESEEITGSRNLAGLQVVDGEGKAEIMAELTYGSWDDILEGALGGTWATNVLKNGSTLKSFGFEKKISDITVPTFFRYDGCVIDTTKLMFKPGDFAQLQFGIKSKVGAAATTTSMSTGTATAVNTNPIMNNAGSISLINEGGSGLVLANSLELNIAQNIRMQRGLGTLGPQGATLGKFRLTGTVEVYFQDKALMDKYLASTVSSIAITIGGSSTLRYAISIPKVLYTNAELTAGSIDQDMIAKLNFTAFYDTGILATMQITRTP